MCASNESNEKIIPCNYGSINHLKGSKLTFRDAFCNEVQNSWCTEKTNKPTDIVIVTEKIDGCNVGVYKKDDVIYPIVRKGHDASTHGIDWIREFANYVQIKHALFMELLDDGERIAGEWMIKTHTLRYHLRTQPFVCFDIFKKDNSRYRYLEFIKKVDSAQLPSVGLVHIGTAIPTAVSINLLGEGFHGALDKPEGVVYRYETKEHGFQFCAKYVSNELVGDPVVFKSNIDSNIFNKFKKYQ